MLGTIAIDVRADETYRSASSGFSFTLPEGWQRYSDDMLQQMTRRVSSAAAQSAMRWDAGFGRKSDPPFTYPYVLVQVVPYPAGGGVPNEQQMKQIVQQLAGASPQDIKKYTSEETQKLMGDAGPSIQAPVFDANNKTVDYAVKLDLPGIGQVSGITRGHFGRNALVQVACYSLASDMPKYRADFDKFENSFSFDSASAYPSGVFSAIARGGVNGGLIGAGIGAVIGVTIAIVAALRKKRA